MKRTKDHTTVIANESRFKTSYIGGATQPGVTLQGTLMNHSSTVASVAKHVNESRILSQRGLARETQPYILGETNSLYNQGAPGLSNSFGAALWGLDFNLHCAANNVRRVHMHQGTNYRYASWQPVQTVNESIGTKAPYYGNVAVARFLGNGGGGAEAGAGNVSVAEINLTGSGDESGGGIYHSAYAAYLNGRLARLAIVQMRAFNYSSPSSSSSQSRPTETFSFQLANSGADANTQQAVKSITAERLLANGSDAITGVTFGGYSFNYELEMGRPVLLKNVSAVEDVVVRAAPGGASGGDAGAFDVEVPWSSAVVLEFHY